MTDYSKGKIYKLISDGTGEIHIGSTTQKSYKRLAVHKCDASSKKGKHCSSRPLSEKGNVKIVLLEDYPSERKELSLARETLYNYKCSIIIKVCVARCIGFSSSNRIQRFGP